MGRGQPRRVGRRIVLRLAEDLITAVDAVVAAERAEGRSSDRGIVISRWLRERIGGAS